MATNGSIIARRYLSGCSPNGSTACRKPQVSERLPRPFNTITVTDRSSVCMRVRWPTIEGCATSRGASADSYQSHECPLAFNRRN